MQVVAAKETGTEAPVKRIENCSFLYTRHLNMYFVALTRSNLEPPFGPLGVGDRERHDRGHPVGDAEDPGQLSRGESNALRAALEKEDQRRRVAQAQALLLLEQREHE